MNQSFDRLEQRASDLIFIPYLSGADVLYYGTEPLLICERHCLT